MTNRKHSKLSSLNLTIQQRIQNEQLYLENNRRISETINGLMEQSDTNDFPIRYGCECSNAQCVGEFFMNSTEFEKLHAGPRMYVICPGHEELDIEEVVEKFEAHYTVRKHQLVGANAHA